MVRSSTECCGLLGLALVLVGALSGCTDLKDIPAGVCGNGVVESGEDCDSTSTTCGQPGTERACRLVCSDDSGCPTGWHCGTDEICREPSGKFAAGPFLPSDQQFQIAAGDFDGDGYADLSSLELSGQIQVTFHDSQTFSGSTTFKSTPFSMAVGRLTDPSAGTDDIVHLGSGAVGVLRGQSDQTLAPVAYAPFSVSDPHSRAVTLNAVSPTLSDAKSIALYAGDEILQFSDTTLFNVQGQVPVFTNLPVATADLLPHVETLSDTTPSPQLRNIPFGNVVEGPDSPCSEILLMKEGDDKVYLVTPCTGPGGTVWNTDVAKLPPVSLPFQAKVGLGGLLARVNDDDHLDLVIAGPNLAPDGQPVKANLYVSFGLGDGTFNSEPVFPPAGGPDQKAKLLFTAGPGLPLASGDLNSDGRGDFVFSTGLALSRDQCISASCPCSIGVGCWEGQDPGKGQFSQAWVADLNANGLSDVIASVDGGRSLVFLNGTGGDLFNAFDVPTTGVPLALAVGDFDGDLVNDVAIVEQGQKQTANGYTEADTLSVAFGKLQGAPERPVAMGTLGAAKYLGFGQMTFLGLDAIGDIGLLSGDDKSASFAIFAGSSDRQLQSPFRLTHGTDSPDLAVLAVAGQFDKNPPSDIAAFSFNGSAQATATSPPRVWALPVTGEAGLDPATTKSTDLDPDLDICTALVEHVDLDQDGVDELVIFARPRLFTKAGGHIVVARMKNGAWVMDPSIDVADLRFSNYVVERLICRQIERASSNKIYRGDDDDWGMTQLADVDANQVPDVLVTTVNAHLKDPAKRPECALTLFKGGASLASSRLDLKMPVDPGAKTAEPIKPLGAVVVNADEDPELEIVLVTEHQLFLAQVDWTTGQVSDPVVIRDYDPLEAASLLRVGGDGLIGAAVRDFNGDGLPDFVLGRELRSEIYYGVPVKP